MKTTLQFILLFFCVFTLRAQSSVKLKINHLLEGEAFERIVESKNDLGNDFMIDRLEYYLSTFSIVHDGGQVTNIDDLYILMSMGDKVGPVEPTIIDLGEFDIQNVESLNFYFGIDEEANHADPALWPIGHALAPKFPSMHWGWAAGYRFIALEGMSGPNFDQELQFHCIGDEFYKELSFPVSMNEADVYTIEIDAEYSNLLSEIDVSGGMIQHGNLGFIKNLADNLMDKVFVPVEVTSVINSELVNVFEVFPNPSTNGIIAFEIDAVGNKNIIKVSDVMGRTISSVPASTQTLDISQSGLYYVSLMDDKGEVLATRKVIIQ